MARTHDLRAAGGSADPSQRVAGGVLVVLGALNLAFGLLSVLTDQVRLPASVGGGLAAAGLVTAAAGVLVWRGSRAATLVALAVFGVLLVVQLGDVTQSPGAAPGALADEPLPRLVVLAVVVVSLAVAGWRIRGQGARTGPS